MSTTPRGPSEALAEAIGRAVAFAGVEPGGLPAEWPARAYRDWRRVDRSGEERTWQRELTGFVAAE